MKTLLRSLTAALAAAVSLSAAAVTTTVDYSDMWYAAPANSESGWGANLAQQGDILFVTLFVYGADNTPRWYVAPNVPSTGANTFRGDLVSVGSGTVFTAPWPGITGVQ